MKIVNLKALELKGKKFGKLTVIERVKNLKKGTMWLCECDCENKTQLVVLGSNLTSRQTSCGCLGRKANGLSTSKIYKTLADMKTRCYKEDYKRYYDYGGRGIKVCDEWMDKENGFLNFYNWSLSNGYEENMGLSIDRIDNDGNYEPSNCKWSTRKEQQNNKRNNRYISINGESKTVAQWSNETGVGLDVIRYRAFEMELKDDEIISRVNISIKHRQSGEKGVYWKDKNKKWQVSLIY